MKYPVDLEDFVGREVFIVGCDGDNEISDIDAFETVEELNDHLETRSPVAESNITVLHGLLTSAECIPDKIGFGAFLVVEDGEEKGTGGVFEVTSTKQEALTSMIEELMNEPGELNSLSIENIYVLYGYEMTLGYVVPESQVDDGLIEEAKEYANAANEMRERLSSAAEE